MEDQPEQTNDSSNKPGLTILAESDIARAQRVTMVQMRLQRILRNAQRLTLVANGNFLVVLVSLIALILLLPIAVTIAIAVPVPICKNKRARTQSQRQN